MLLIRGCCMGMVGRIYRGELFRLCARGGMLRRIGRPATIYAFDIMRTPTSTTSTSPYLINRRTFAYASNHLPDGIKCDMKGNVYSGTGCGVEVWNPTGSLIGKIVVPGSQGCANFCFGLEGEMFLCGEQRLWRVQLNSWEGGKDEGTGEGLRGDLLGV
jgi:sugar lactone lactonase YvrE